MFIRRVSTTERAPSAAALLALAWAALVALLGAPLLADVLVAGRGSDWFWTLHVVAVALLAALWGRRGGVAGVGLSLALIVIDVSLETWLRIGSAAGTQPRTIAVTLALNCMVALIIVVVTETRMRQARAAEQSLARLAAIIASSADAILGVSLNGTITNWNAGAERLYEHTTAQAFGRDIDLIVPPGQRTHVTQLLAVIARGEPVARVETQRVRQDGALLDIALTLSPTRDAAGVIDGVSVIARDISERKRSEAALHAGERLYRALAAHFPRGAIMLFDRDLRFTVADGAGLASVGLSPAKLVGKTLQEVFPRRVSAQLEPHYHAALAGEETRCEIAFGRAFYEVTTLPVRDDHGLIVAGMALTVDATERERVARQLRDAEARYRLLVEQMPAITYTSAADEHSSTIYTSPQRERLLGYSAEEWTSTPDFWLNVLHPEDRERVRATIARSNADGLPVSMEYRYIARDGRVVWVRDEAVLARDARGHPLHWQGVALDITEHKEAEARLRESEERFRSAFDDAGIGMSIARLDGRWVRVNAPLAAMLGYTQEELLNCGAFWTVTHPDDVELQRAHVAALLTGESRTFEMEKRYIRQDGEIVYAMLNVSTMTNPVGEPLYLVAQTQDITARKRVEAALRESEQRFRSVFESPALGISVNGLDGTWLQVNDALCDLLGYSVAEFRDTTFRALTHPDDLAMNRENERRLVSGEVSAYQAEKRYLHKTGRAVWTQINVSIVRDSHEQPLYFVAQIHDISQRKAIEEQLHRQARYDGLTQLPNRALFMERLEHALARTQRSGETVGVMFIDLDGFKAVNDTLGHAAGDRLLAEVATRLQACVRASDTVARLGGDEFTALIDGLTEPGVAATVARRMIDAVGHAYDLDGVTAHVGASIGIAFGGLLATEPARLMQEADTALYEAKARGKRQHVIFDELLADLASVAPPHLAPTLLEPERAPTPLASRRGSSGR